MRVSVRIHQCSPIPDQLKSRRNLIPVVGQFRGARSLEGEFSGHDKSTFPRFSVYEADYFLPYSNTSGRVGHEPWRPCEGTVKPLTLHFRWSTITHPSYICSETIIIPLIHSVTLSRTLAETGRVNLSLVVIYW